MIRAKKRGRKTRPLVMPPVKVVLGPRRGNPGRIAGDADVDAIDGKGGCHEKQPDENNAR